MVWNVFMSVSVILVVIYRNVKKLRLKIKSYIY